MKKFILALIILLTTTKCFAADFYLRDDGGTFPQCSGKVDAPAVSGSTACALNSPFFLVAAGQKGGDTIFVDGVFMIGFGAPGATGSGCNTAWPYDCVLPSIPSGPNALMPTRILGKGWNAGCPNPPEFWGTERAQYVLGLFGSNNVEIQCLDITDHSACTWYAGGDPNTRCKRDKYPYGPQADYGIKATDSSNVYINYVSIHGLHIGGIQAGRIKDWTIENSKIRSNSLVGFDGDVLGNDENKGTIKFKNTEIKFNGCGETFPTKQPYNCLGQTAGGYGDGLGVGFNTSARWIFDHVDVSNNTSDGIDLLYGDGSGYVEVKNSTLAGNAGNQLKTQQPTLVENTTLKGNCDYFTTENKYINYAVDDCRAGGNTLAFAFNPGTKMEVKNSTITGNGDVLIQTSGNNCNGTESVTVKDGSSLTGGQEFHGGDDVGLIYNTGATGNGDGPCGSLKSIWENVTINHVKNDYCPPGTGVICGGSTPPPPPTGPICGDSICNGTEICSSCAADCGVCVPPPPTPNPTYKWLTIPDVTFIQQIKYSVTNTGFKVKSVGKWKEFKGIEEIQGLRTTTGAFDYKFKQRTN